MKVSNIGSTYKSVNFGRSLNKEEINGAYKAAQDARALMGFQNGNGLLILPSDKLPKGQGADLKEQLARFFDGVKKLLGINSVEILDTTGEAVDTTVQTALEENGLKRFAKFSIPQNPEDIAKAVEEAAKSADGLRVFADGDNVTKEQLQLIEDTFKKVKGDAFDPKMLIYEHNNKAYQWGDDIISKVFDGKVIVTSSDHMNDNGGVLWGSKSFVTDRMKAKQGDFIHGLRHAFNDGDLATQMQDGEQIKAAQHLLEEELKLHDEEILHPARFAAAKRADVALSQNFYKYFDDIIPGVHTDVAGFEKAYQQALQEGIGDNYFDSLAKAMKALGLDQSSPEVYESVCKYRNALFSAGAQTVEDLAQVAAEDLEASYKDTKNVVLQGVEAKKAAIKAAEEELARKAAEQKKNMEALQQFLATQQSIIEDGKTLRAAMNPADLTFCDRAVNYARAHKAQFAVVGALAALFAIGGTMYSYGKEIAKKSDAAKPKPDFVN